MYMDKKVYNISSDKNISIKIAQISDIHFSIDYNLKRLDKIKKNLKELSPDYVCIIGDLIDEYNDSNIDVFRNWLKDLSSSFKLIIVVGNHDLIVKKNGKYIEHSDISWLKSLRSNNLIVLDNDIYSDGNINFVGYSLDFSYYYHHESISYDRYNKDLCKLLSRVHDGVNILLVHTPSFFFENKNYKNITDLSKLDLVLCGHTHGGLMPPFFPGHFGIVSPTRTFFPRFVRGIIKIDSTLVIISSGIMKLSRKSGLSMLNDIYGYNINLINISNKN